MLSRAWTIPLIRYLDPSRIVSFASSPTWAGASLHPFHFVCRPCSRAPLLRYPFLSFLYRGHLHHRPIRLSHPRTSHRAPIRHGKQIGRQCGERRILDRGTVDVANESVTGFLHETLREILRVEARPCLVLGGCCWKQRVSCDCSL